MRSRGSRCRPPEAKPSAVSASLSVTHGRPAVTRRVWPRWSRRAARSGPDRDCNPRRRKFAWPCPPRADWHPRSPRRPGRRRPRATASAHGGDVPNANKVESHIENRAPHRFASLGDGDPLGVRTSARRRRAAADDCAVPHQNRADGGIGRRQSERALPQIEGRVHPAFVVRLRRRRPGHGTEVSLRGLAFRADAASGSASSSPTIALKSRASRKSR